MPIRPIYVAIVFTLALTAGCGGGKGSKNLPPVFASSAGVSIEENTAGTFYEALATDPEEKPVTYSLLSGDDSALFSIAEDTGALHFITPPDFEAPGDQDGDNEYSITLVASVDEDDTSILPLAISVTDVSDLEFRVTFPTPKGNIGGFSKTHIAGVVIDHEDGEVLDGDVKQLDVNGHAATLIYGSPLRWNVEIPVTGHSIEVTSTITFRDDTVAQDVRQLANEVPLIDGKAIDLDEARGRILIGGGPKHQVITAFDMSTKRGTMLYGNAPGGTAMHAAPDLFLYDDGNSTRMVGTNAYSGLNLYNFASNGYQYSQNLATEETILSDRDIVHHESQNSAIVSYRSPNKIVSINLTTGDKTTLYDSTTGSGDIPASVDSLAIDSANNLLYVLDYNTILSLNLSTLERSFISGPGIGTGPAISQTIDITYDANADTIYATEVNQVIAIDPASGNRRVLSGSDIGSGPPIITARDAELSNDGSTLYILNDEGTQILTVNTSTGDRSVFLESRLGSGVKSHNLQNAYLHRQTGSLIATAGIDAKLIAVDLASGNRSELSSNAVGTGPGLSYLSDITPNNSSSLLMNDAHTLNFYLVDIASGNRMKVGDNEIGFGDRFSIPSIFSYRNGTSQLFVGDVAQNAIFSLNMAGGYRTIISNASHGTGPTLLSIFDMHYDATEDSLYVADNSLKAVLAIDPDTGDRTVIAGPSVGSGVSIRGPRQVTAGLTSATLIINDYPSGFMSIDKETGIRKAIPEDTSRLSSYLGTVTPNSSASITSDAENNVIYLCGASTGFVMAMHPESGQKALVSY